MNPVNTEVTGEGLHPATERLVDEFSTALKAKLHAAQLKYGWTDQWLVNDWREECQLQVQEHVAKGDPLDVAAYAAFCWRRGWPTAQPGLRSPVEPPCVHCVGSGWVNDENWSPAFPDVHQGREPGNGLIRCGICGGPQ